MKVKDFDDFRAPNRKPWLLLLVVAVGAAVLLHHLLPSKPSAEEETDVPVAQEVGSEEDVGSHSTSDRDIPATVGDLELMKQAKQCEADGDLLGARRRYLALLQRTSNAKTRSEAEIRVGGVNVALVTTPHKMPEKEDYIVKRGDSVQRIARHFGTTVELIQKSNELKNPHLIKVGDRFRILRGTFAIFVSKGDNSLRVTFNGQFFKRYAVGTGKYGKTPVGTFEITQDKQKEPVWWHPSGKEIPYGDPKNILGTRWMAIRATGDTPPVRGYGIHGTWDESSIGKALSAGCIRMRNKDVEELYMLVPVGTAVTIKE
jgi:lipoprotein-anchoring transpeptidase ErfK/SrfK